MLTLQLLRSHERVQQVEHDEESDDPYDEILEIHRIAPPFLDAVNCEY